MNLFDVLSLIGGLLGSDAFTYAQNAVQEEAFLRI